jgi:ceramide glucosyltransferase
MFARTPSRPRSRRVALVLLAWYALDRLLKLLAVRAFFRRAAVPTPAAWPSVTLVQPITRSRHDLAPILQARRALDYPGPVQQLLICDRADTASQDQCRAVLGAAVEIVLADPDGGAIATKVAKLQVALPLIRGEIACFVDDDVTLPPAALRRLVAPLARPDAGATFGLARYTAWETSWSSLMSLFVNSNALLSYLPLARLIEPFTITGHCFALRHATLTAIGGLDGHAGRIDDDHELARRVRAHNLRIIQTPLIYDVTNQLDSPAAYQAQLKRWFVFPRQAMLPYLRPGERLFMTFGSLGNLIPGLLALLALLHRRRSPAVACGLAVILSFAVEAIIECGYLGRVTPLRRLALLPLVVIATPLHILALLCAPPTVEWRGQRLRIHRGGAFTVLGPARDQRETAL